MKKYNTIIIGAGPAGMFAGINLKTDSNNLLIEKNDIAGRKLLMSGAGKCNITHTGKVDEFLKKYGDNGKFLKNSLKLFDNHKVIDYLKNKGIDVVVDDNGKIFPNSMKSRDILNLLLDELKQNKIDIIYNTTVIDIKSGDTEFELICKDKRYQCKNLIIATGGKSYATTGSSGDGYKFAQKMGLNVLELKPALSPIYTADGEFEELAGISLKNVKVAVYKNSKKYKEYEGDIGFTHYGLSGPVILDISRYLTENDMLKINFVGENISEMRNKFVEYSQINGKKQINKFFKECKFPENFSRFILKKSNINAELKMAEINKNTRQILLENLCEYTVIVNKIGSFDVAMATCGGIDLKDINPKTMESKLVKNLYFIGEVLDSDGDTGGYNIQAAFSTAYTAAKAISKKDDKNGKSVL